MNPSSTSNTKNGNCCCCQPIFLPLFIVFLAFLIAYGFQISLLWQQRSALKNRQAQLQKLTPQVQLVNGTLGKLSRELLNLAATNEEARRIVADFRIQSNSLPSGEAAPSTSAGPDAAATGASAAKPENK